MSDPNKIESRYRLKRLKSYQAKQKILHRRANSQDDLAHRAKTFRDGVSINSWAVCSTEKPKLRLPKFSANELAGLDKERKLKVLDNLNHVMRSMDEIMAAPFICAEFEEE